MSGEIPIPFEVILAPATSSGQSPGFVVGRNPVMVQAYASGAAFTTAAEYLDLQWNDPAGEWEDVYDASYVGATSNQVRLHAGNKGVVINAPGFYRIDKDATTQSVGVAIRAMRLPE